MACQCRGWQVGAAYHHGSTRRPVAAQPTPESGPHGHSRGRRRCRDAALITMLGASRSSARTSLGGSGLGPGHQSVVPSRDAPPIIIWSRVTRPFAAPMGDRRTLSTASAARESAGRRRSRKGRKELHSPKRRPPAEIRDKPTPAVPRSRTADSGFQFHQLAAATPKLAAPPLRPDFPQ